jgi:hypothetical protein
MYLNSIQVACNVIQYQLFFFFCDEFLPLDDKRKGGWKKKTPMFNIFI